MTKIKVDKKMKQKTLLLIAATLMVLSLTACGGGLSGAYKGNESATESTVYTFKGTKASITVKGTLVFEGSYKIDGDMLILDGFLPMESIREILHYSYRKDGNTLWINWHDYVKTS